MTVRVERDRDPPERIEAGRRGDRDALEALFAPHLPSIERVLFRLVREAADVEDLVQSTIAEAIVGFARFRGDASVKTWLLRIAARQASALWRSPSRRRVVLGVVPDDAAVAPGRIDAQVEARRHLDRVYHHLAAIAPKKRVAFILHVIDGRAIDDVASIMDASVTATKSRVLWGRRALIARLRRDPLAADLVRELEDER
jgi:RNA polymerase sigma-70 factor (ECF subfamily)